MLDNIRKSIQEKMQDKIKQQRNEQIPMDVLPTMEEKHGYIDQAQYSQLSKMKNNQKSKHNSYTFIPKIILAMVVFVSVMLLHIMTENDATTSLSVNYLLKEDFPFATVYNWYEDNVHPISLPFTENEQIEANESLQNDTVIETFQMNGSGIVFQPAADKHLYALSDGIVVFAGMKTDTNRTIIIQHPNKTKAIYGNLSTIDVPLYKRVKQHEKIGSFENDGEDASYFLAIEKNGTYIDPLLYEFDGNNE